MDFLVKGARFVQVRKKISGLIKLIGERPKDAGAYNQWAYNFHTQMDGLIASCKGENRATENLEILVKIICTEGEAFLRLLDENQTKALCGILGENSQLEPLLHLYQDFDEKGAQGLWDSLHEQLHDETMDVVKKHEDHIKKMGVSIEGITNKFAVGYLYSDHNSVLRICDAFQTNLKNIQEEKWWWEGQSSDFLLCMLLIVRSKEIRGEFPLAFLTKLYWIKDRMYKLRDLQDKAIDQTIHDTMQKIQEIRHSEAIYIGEYFGLEKYFRDQIETLTKLDKYGFDNVHKKRAVEIANFILTKDKVWALGFSKECLGFLKRLAGGFTDYFHYKLEFDGLLFDRRFEDCKEFIIGKQKKIWTLCSPYVKTESLRSAMSEELWTDEGIKNYFIKHGYDVNSIQAFASVLGYQSFACLAIAHDLGEAQTQSGNNAAVFPMILQVHWLQRLWTSLHEGQKSTAGTQKMSHTHCAFCNTPKPFK